MEASVGTVFFYATLTALATGLGAVPLLFFRRVSRRWLGLGYALATGLMLAASFRLLQEGLAYGAPRTIAGLLLGVVLIWYSRRRLGDQGELRVGRLRGANALQALMIVGVMTVHSFAEGVGVGVSFGGGEVFGAFITAAIAVHNIPEGLAISLVLVPKGVSVWRAALWSVFSSLPQPLMAVPAYLFVETFAPALPIGLGFAAGAMIWMVFAELIPDALEETPSAQVATAVAIAVAAMIAFGAWMDG